MFHQDELRATLKRNGFREAAKAVRRFAAKAKPHHIGAKLEQWSLWEGHQGWPWPQWDRKSEKDWYSLRHECKF